jgi:hypothetical protein
LLRKLHKQLYSKNEDANQKMETTDKQLETRQSSTTDSIQQRSSALETVAEFEKLRAEGTAILLLAHSGH